MIIDILTDAIKQNIGSLRPAPKHWYKRNCMLCQVRGYGADTRYRFGIQFNPQSIALNCFNCGYSSGFTEGKELSTPFKFFLRHIHIDQKFVEQLEFEIFKQKNRLDIIRDGETNSLQDKEARLRSLIQQWKPTELPKDSLSLTEWLEHGLDDPEFLRVVEYTLERKIYDLDQFYWSPDTRNDINQRVIIPYYYKNEIVGYTARLCYNIPDKTIPKYLQQCPIDFVYNLDRYQDWSRKYVIVTEGVLDAWTVDGVSVLGEVGQTKVDIINRLQKQVIVCPDRDKKGGDLVGIAMDNNWAVAFPRWDTDIKDAAKAAEKYGRLLTTQSIISSAIYGKDKIKLKWKIQDNERNRKRK